MVVATSMNECLQNNKHDSGNNVHVYAVPASRGSAGQSTEYLFNNGMRESTRNPSVEEIDTQLHQPQSYIEPPSVAQLQVFDADD